MAFGWNIDALNNLDLYLNRDLKKFLEALLVIPVDPLILVNKILIFNN